MGLEEKVWEEKEKESRRLQAEAAETMDQARLLSEQAAKRRRKKKKKRKKKLPCTSSHCSCGRARRRQRQWYARHCCFAGCDALRDVFPLVDDWHPMLGITAGMDQKDSIIVVVMMAVAHGRLVLLVSLFALCFFCRCQALMPASWPVWTRWTVTRCVLIKVIYIPVVAQRQFSMVQTVLRTIAISLSFLDMVVNAPVMQVCRPSKSLSWRRGSFPWFSRPWAFPVAGHGD